MKHSIWLLALLITASGCGDPLSPTMQMSEIRGADLGEEPEVTPSEITPADIPPVDTAADDIPPVDTVADDNTTCSPECTDRECGDDGCGGSCGQCEEAQDECADGHCVCQPACEVIECGDDGCEGSCGDCAQDEYCAMGKCAPLCGNGVCIDGEDCNSCPEDCGACSCGGVVCPTLADYTISCNAQEHCEYVNQDATGWKQWDVWIYVPPGAFLMGSSGEYGGDEWELPVHEVTITEGFFLGKYEVVVAQYEACMAANPTGCTPPSTDDWNGEGWGVNSGSNNRTDHPQNGLTWQQAKDFCAWVAPGGRFPTEAEWEYAASGPVHRLYPWGNEPFPTCSNDTAVFRESGGAEGFGCGVGGSWPVGMKPAGASWSGALDMSGNLWEWTEDCWHGSYDEAPNDGSAWVFPECGKRTIRGASFYHHAQTIRTSQRYGIYSTFRAAYFGARCVRPVEP